MCSRSANRRCIPAGQLRKQQARHYRRWDDGQDGSTRVCRQGWNSVQSLLAFSMRVSTIERHKYTCSKHRESGVLVEAGQGCDFFAYQLEASCLQMSFFAYNCVFELLCLQFELFYLQFELFGLQLSFFAYSGKCI